MDTVTANPFALFYGWAGPGKPVDRRVTWNIIGVHNCHKGFQSVSGKPSDV